MKKKLLLATILTITFIYSCKKDETKEEKKETKTEVPQNQLATKINQLEDSSTVTWSSMMAADDQKIAFIKRLLDEISYTPKYDIIKHTRLAEKTKALKSKRYDLQNMTSENIDKYDLATDSLIREVKALVLSTPNIENYPLCNELLNDITALDNDVVMNRVKYDNWAMQYNTLLEQHGEELKALGQPYNDLKPKATFQLNN